VAAGKCIVTAQERALHGLAADSRTRPTEGPALMQRTGCLRATIIANHAMSTPQLPYKEQEPGVVVAPSKPEVARPPMYQVVLLNDDYTPMDFVVAVLEIFFDMNREKATQVMLHVHTRGKGICGVYTREVAETKVTQVNEFSRSHQHPLLCTMEKA
jgi:ATP-dependent Clp protease adaptor protein ClpS